MKRKRKKKKKRKTVTLPPSKAMSPRHDSLECLVTLEDVDVRRSPLGVVDFYSPAVVLGPSSTPLVGDLPDVHCFLQAVRAREVDVRLPSFSDRSGQFLVRAVSLAIQAGPTSEDGGRTNRRRGGR